MVKARPLIKQVIKSCVTIRRLYAKPCVQQMADLPQDRLVMNKPAFTIVGLDIFGRFAVKYGRSEIKRFGCLFTCFGSRVVHVEKLDCKDTDSLISDFRRFVVRRGQPHTVYSDLGTNLVGSHRELTESMKVLQPNVIADYPLRRDMLWHFRPPSASHWGGVWERMIGMVRRILPAILSKTRLTDEILHTVFCEVDGIINGRPLTKLSDSRSRQIICCCCVAKTMSRLVYFHNLICWESIGGMCRIWQINFGANGSELICRNYNAALNGLGLLRIYV